MMILVAVTINFALNGGIITKSKQASKQMQKAADLEELQLAVVSSIDYLTGKVVRQDLVSSLSNGWQVTSSTPYTCTSPSGNVFTVTEDGKITEEGEGTGQTEDPDLIYLKTLIGQDFINDLIADMSGWVFKDSNMELDMVAAQQLTESDMIDNGDGTYNMAYPIYYKGKPYNMLLKVDETNQTAEILDVRTRTATSNSSSSSSDDPTSGGPAVIETGNYVRLNNIDYIIMAEDTINGTVDLISKNALQISGVSIYLGDDDPDAINNATDINNNGTISNFEKSVYSYNNVVNRLVVACKDATGLTVDGTDIISVRSVGNKNVKYTSSGISGSDNPGTYTYDWETAGAQSDWYTTNNYGIYNLKAGDNNYQSDYNLMATLGILQTGNQYWLASRVVDEYSDDIGFCIFYVCHNGSVAYECICSVNEDGSTYSDDELNLIRAIVTINDSLLDNVTGTGTSADPFVIQ